MVEVEINMSNVQTTTATNITVPDLSTNSAINDAPKYFNNFYSTPFNVSGNTNDAVIAFFQQYTQNVTAANNLASAVLYTAMSQNLDPMSILSQFESLPKGQLNAYLAAFLNVSRVPTSSLGFNNGSKNTSPYVTRSILL
jgi:hypothetical protein